MAMSQAFDGCGVVARIVMRVGWVLGKIAVRLGTLILERLPENLRLRVFHALVKKIGASVPLEHRREVLRTEICETVEPAERFLVPAFEAGHASEQDRFYAYQQRFVTFRVQPGEKVLDIGSGPNPFPLATHQADLFLKETSHRQEPLKRTGLPLMVCDLERLPCRDKAFDFIYCSHVLEHVQDPAKACEELMRVGKQGYVETPTRMSDIIFNYIRLQGHHRWHVNCVGGSLIFMEWEDRERRDTQIHEFFSMAKSRYKNPFQDLFHHHRDLFVNMLLWKDSFPYFIFSKDGRLVETNSRAMN